MAGSILLGGSKPTVPTAPAAPSQPAVTQSQWDFFNQINQAGGIDKYITGLQQAAAAPYISQVNSLTQQLNSTNQQQAMYQQQLATLQNTSASSREELAAQQQLVQDLQNQFAQATATSGQAKSQYEKEIAALQTAAQQGSLDLATLQANYDEIVKQAAARAEQYAPLVEQMGEAEKDALIRQRQKAEAQAMQTMISRGVGKTTVADMAKREIGQAGEAALSQLEGKLTKEKLGYLQSLGQDVLSARGQAISAQEEGAKQLFSMQQAPITLQEEYAKYLASQNIANAQLRAGQQSLSAAGASIADTLNAEALAFNNAKKLQEAQFQAGLQYQQALNAAQDQARKAQIKASKPAMQYYRYGYGLPASFGGNFTTVGYAR